MKHIIHSSEDLGFALRAVRKSAKVRLDDLSQTARVSKQTTANLEKGKPTVQLGKVLQLLKEVGQACEAAVKVGAYAQLQVHAATLAQLLLVVV